MKKILLAFILIGQLAYSQNLIDISKSLESVRLNITAQDKYSRDEIVVVTIDIECAITGIWELNISLWENDWIVQNAKVASVKVSGDINNEWRSTITLKFKPLRHKENGVIEIFATAGPSNLGYTSPSRSNPLNLACK